VERGRHWIWRTREFEWIGAAIWCWNGSGAASSGNGDCTASRRVIAKNTIDNGGAGSSAGSVSIVICKWSSLTSGSNGVDSYWGGGTCSVGEVVLVNIGSLTKDQDEDAEKEDAAYHVELWVGKQSGLDNVDKKYLLQQPIIISFSLVHLFSRSSLKGGSIFQRDVLFQ
jgi:hypothetical protein